ncbi:MAG TPA: hypothetical protein VF912_20950 [Anaeromyxobacter sp.]
MSGTVPLETSRHIREAPRPATTAAASSAGAVGEGRAAEEGGGAAAAVLLSAVFAAVTAPLWLGRVVPRWDALDFFYPVVTYISDALREGRFPLWDPYSGAGEPFHAEPQKLVLNPVVLLLARFVSNPLLAFVLVWLVHWWWGAMGMVWVARRFGASAAGAFLAGGSYALSGFFVSHAEHTTFIFVAAWLPWTIGLADAAVARRSAPSASLAAAALGASAAFGGYPMLVTFTGVAVAVWLLLRFVVLPEGGDLGERRARARWAAGTLALMASVLVLAWSPILHAFMSEAAVITSRLSTVSPVDAIYGQAFTLRSALSLVLPYAPIVLHDSGVDRTSELSVTNAYMGFATIPLAVTWAWISLRERRQGASLVAFTAFMVLVSLGGVGGVRILLHYVVPPLRFMRFNAAFRLYWIFPACLAAGLGLTCVVEREAARRVFLRVALGWTAVAAAAAAVVWMWLDGIGVSPRPALPSLVLPFALASPAVVLAAWWISRRPSSAGGALLAAIAFLDVAAGLYVNRFTVWSSDQGVLAAISHAQDARTRTTATAGDPPPRTVSPVGYWDPDVLPFNAQLILKISLLDSYTTLGHPDLKTLVAGRFSETLCGPRRFWLAPGGEPFLEREVALVELALSGGRGEPVPVFVEGGGSPAPRVVPGTYGDVAVESYRPEEIVLRVAAPAQGGLLTSVERYAPGWKVAVDGRPAAAVQTNLLFRGVFLDAGAHRVVWTYDPDLWWPLVAVSVATLSLALLAAGAFALTARRRAA